MNDNNCPRISAVLPSNLRNGQSGAVLVISLIILLIMTLLGVTAMGTTTLEEKMAGNMRDRNVALQSSESALINAETAIAGLSLAPSIEENCTTTNCAWPLNRLTDIGSQSASWWVSNTLEYGTSGAVDISGVQADPRFVIEEQAFVPDSLDITQDGSRSGTNYYRITARGTGATNDAQVVLQSTYAMRFQ